MGKGTPIDYASIHAATLSAAHQAASRAAATPSGPPPTPGVPMASPSQRYVGPPKKDYSGDLEDN